MPLSHQWVQACHAAVAAGRDLIRCPQPYLILVTVPAKHDLVALSVRLSRAGIDHRVFHEDDMGGRPTALATRPILQRDRRHFRDLPLAAVPEAVAA
jgi:hypothetical protein